MSANDKTSDLYKIQIFRHVTKHLTFLLLIYGPAHTRECIQNVRVHAYVFAGIRTQETYIDKMTFSKHKQTKRILKPAGPRLNRIRMNLRE